MIRRQFTIASCLLIMVVMFSGVQAKADAVFFRFTGGPWSVSYHSGWHRYWGGPTVGFYYAPAPCYVVAGYPDPYYYEGPSFWYANPSFGLNLTIGGRGRGPVFDRVVTHDRSVRDVTRDTSGRIFSGHESGGHSFGGHESGGHSFGGHESGGHGFGGGHDRR